MNDHQDDAEDISETNPHAALWKSENYVSPSEQAWDRFYAKAERLLGHHLDGDEKENGYSIDGAYAAFEAGETADAYVAEVKAGDNYKPWQQEGKAQMDG